jgi:hypothetical protein
MGQRSRAKACLPALLAGTPGSRPDCRLRFAPPTRSCCQAHIRWRAFRVTSAGLGPNSLPRHTRWTMIHLAQDKNFHSKCSSFTRWLSRPSLYTLSDHSSCRVFSVSLCTRVNRRTLWCRPFRSLWRHLVPRGITKFCLPRGYSSRSNHRPGFAIQ